MWRRVLYAAALALTSVGLGCTEPSISCCVDDGDCDDAATCFEGTCAPRCFSAADCLGEQLCSPSGACTFIDRPASVCPFDPPAPPTCDDDEFEENDREEDAAALVSGAELVLCPGDRDAFFLNADAPLAGVLTVDDGAEVELEIVTPGGDRISLLSVDGRIPFNLGEPSGRHLLLVRGTSGVEVVGARYVIDVVVPSPQCQQDDPNEPNDVVGGLLINGDSVNGVVCADDLDRFIIPVREDALVFVGISHSAAEGIAAEIQRLPDGNLVQANAEPFFSSFEFRSVADGDLEVRIRSVNGEENPYLVDVFIEGGIEPSDCPNDLFEPNDDNDQATALDLPILTAATLCGGDRDIFEFFAEQDVSVRLRIEHNHPDGVFVQVRRGGAQGATADTGPGFASLNFRSAADGPLFVDVQSTDDRPVDYVLRLFEEDGPRSASVGPDDCGFDTNEPNNAPADATGINNRVLEGQVCETDIDLFAIQLGFFVEVTNGELLATVLDANGQPIDAFLVDNLLDVDLIEDGRFLLLTADQTVDYAVFE